MVRCSLWMVLTFVSLTLAAAPLVPVTGRVVKAPLNVRAGAGKEYTVVGRLPLNSEVAITAVGKDWLEIRAPENTAAWVMARYIRKNRFTAGVILRSGPGIGYEKVGSAGSGVSVQPDGQTTPNGWVLVKPFYWMRVYVGRPAVEADEAALAKLPPLPRQSAPASKAVTKLELSFTKPEEPGAALTGHLYPLDDAKSAITHVLHIEKGGELVPAAFAASFGPDLKPFQEKHVTLRGVKGEIKGWDLPVLIVTSVSAAP